MDFENKSELIQYLQSKIIKADSSDSVAQGSERRVALAYVVQLHCSGPREAELNKLSEAVKELHRTVTQAMEILVKMNTKMSEEHRKLNELK